MSKTRNERTVKKYPESMEMTITDIECPLCGSMDTHISYVNECEFEYNGKGHYYIDCFCNHCMNYFAKFYKFKYVLTEEWNH